MGKIMLDHLKGSPRSMQVKHIMARSYPQLGTWIFHAASHTWFPRKMILLMNSSPLNQQNLFCLVTIDRFFSVEFPSGVSHSISSACKDRCAISGFKCSICYY